MGTLTIRHMGVPVLERTVAIIQRGSNNHVVLMATIGNSNLPVNSVYSEFCITELFGGLQSRNTRLCSVFCNTELL